MRILLLADIHANWPALQALHALDEPHDLCFVLGDLVDYGLDPVPCIEWVQEHAHYAIRGNHDHAVAQRAIANGTGGYKYLSAVTRTLTWERLSSAYLRYLGTLPVSYVLNVENTRFLLVHATPRDPLDEYAPCDPAFWARRLERVQADVVCVGHTHQPYVLPVGDKLVINPGSIGQPRDGDPRACYAIWDNGQVELKRVSYRIEDTVNTIQASKLPEQAKQVLTEVYRTAALPRPNGATNHVPATPVVPAPEPPAETRAEEDSATNGSGAEPGPRVPSAPVGEAAPESSTDVTIELEQKTPPPPENLDAPWPFAPSTPATVDLTETLPGPFDFRFDLVEQEPPPKREAGAKNEPPK